MQCAINNHFIFFVGIIALCFKHIVMCASTQSLQAIINQLEKNVYPSVMQLLSFNMHPDRNAPLLCSDDVLSTIQNSILVQLKNELVSLELYESRLVFPAIYTYLHQDSKDFIPDINTIERLINHKEEKINQCVRVFNEAMDNASCVVKTAWKQNDIEQSLTELSNYLKNEFLPARMVWMELLRGLKNELTVHQKSSLCKNRSEGMCCCKKDKEREVV